MRKLLRPARKLVNIGNRVVLKGHRLGTRLEKKLSEVTDSGAKFTKSNKTRALNEVLYKENRDLYNQDPIFPALPRLRKDAVNLFVPTIDESAMFGGIATALRVASKIAQQKKYNLRIICVDKSGNLGHANDFLKSIGGEKLRKDSLIDISNRQGFSYGYCDLKPNDINIATAWWTAKALEEMCLEKQFVYLIQDFEPIFYPYGDLYVDAINTYSPGNYIALCNTELVKNYLIERGFGHIKKHSISFEPAVDKNVFYPRPKALDINQKKRLFVYARPNVDRNLYLHSLKLLDEAFDRGILNSSEWDLYMAGQDKSPNIKLNNGLVINNLGKMTFSQYAEFAGTIDMAISLMMAPHPSYPPLEMSVSGAVVVTNKYSIKTDLGMYSKNIFMGDLTIESLLKTLHSASKVSKEQAVENAKQSSISGDWESALQEPIKNLIDKLS